MRPIALATLALLLLASRALGADPCRHGAATLADLRDLAGLREAVEHACSCASFDGRAGRGRAAYRDCARRVRDAALGAGSLRAACRAAATQDYTKSTCGTHQVACAHHARRSSREPLGCRIAAALSCESGRSFVERACSEQTHCSDVVDWTASTCNDVRAQGPYGAGVRMMSFAKPSELLPAESRALETVVWYPTAPDAAPVSAPHRAVLDAPVDLSDGPYPVLLFSHGSCGYPLQSTFLLPRIASWGFVVVAPPHPGNTIYEYPGCGSAASQAASYVERPSDVIFVLDQMLAESERAGSPFRGALDAARIGMSGHSFGGLTTYLVQARDPRIRVAIPMAPAALFDPVLTVPSLSMVGEIDSVVDNQETRAAWERSARPGFFVEIGDAGHYAFSDACRGTADCDPPRTRTQDEAHDLVLRWVLPFLQVYLGGDAGGEPFLSAKSAAAGARVERR